MATSVAPVLTQRRRSHSAAAPAPVVRRRPVLSATTVAALVPVALSAAISQTWFRAGSFIARGDIGLFVQDGLRPEFGWLWNHQTVGTGSTSPAIVLAPAVVVSNLVHVVGGSDILAQRVFLGLDMAFMAGGVVFLCSVFTRSPLAMACGGMVAVVNPFVLGNVPSPLTPVAIGTLGLLVGLVGRVVRGRRVRPWQVALATLPCAYLGANPPLLLVVASGVVSAVVAALLVDRGSRRALSALALRAAPLVVLVNLWWLVPVVLTSLPGAEGVRFGAETDVSAWAWTHARSSVANVLTLNASWTWDFPEYVSYARSLGAPLWTALRFALPVLALAAPLVSVGRRKSVALTLVGSALVLVFVAKGLHPPARGANLWLYRHVPGLWLLREPMAKLGVLLVVLFACLVTLTVDGLTRRRGGSPFRWTTVAVAAVAATLACSYPIFTPQAVQAASASLPGGNVRLPEAWRATARALNAAPGNGKVLVLPLADYYQMPTTWGYYGVDNVAQALLERPVVQRSALAYFELDPRLERLLSDTERAVSSGAPETASLLRMLGVSHVLARRDLDTTVEGRTFADPTAIARGLERTPSLRPFLRNAVAEVFSVDEPTTAQVLPAQFASVDIGTKVRGLDPLRPGSGLVDDRVGVDSRRTSPARYSIAIRNAPPTFLLTVPEGYSRGWVLRGLPRPASARHQKVYGYANGWLVGGAPDHLVLTASYQPAQWARLALRVSQGSLVLLGLWLLACCTGIARRGRTTWQRLRHRAARPAPVREEDTGGTV